MFDLAQYALTVHSIAPLIVGLLLTVLGLAVLVRERLAWVSVSFFLLTGAGALWTLCYLGIFSSKSPGLALKWVLLQHIGVVFIPALAHWFTHQITWRRHDGIPPRWSFVFSSVMALAVYGTEEFVSGIQAFPWGYYAQYGPLSLLFALYLFSVTAYVLTLLWSERRRAATTTHRRRLTLFFVAFAFGFLGSAVDLLPAFGAPVYPAGNAGVIVFICLSAWTIWRYRLVEITPAFASEEILSTLADALLVIDYEGMVRVANQAAHHLFRHPREGLTGRHIGQISDRFLPLEKLRLLMRVGRLEPYEIVYERKGKTHFLEITASAIRDHTGQYIGAVCIAHDITQRKKAEEALRRTHRRLQEAHQKLKNAQMQLIQAAKMESVGQLAAGVAHEVKNPLAVILQSLDLLEKQSSQTAEDTTFLAIREGKQAIRRADQVIRGLLDFSSAKTSRMEPGNLNGPIRSALALTRHALEKSRVEVVLSLSGKLPSCRIDPDRMEQVFVNLFMNAAHAMQGAGTLRVRTREMELPDPLPEPASLEPGAFKPGDVVVMAEVEDTGPGVPPELLEKVFDPFVTSKTPGHGTGLGLTVTRSIVELHGGAIGIRNVPQGGARATVMLKATGGSGGLSDE